MKIDRKNTQRADFAIALDHEPRDRKRQKTKARDKARRDKAKRRQWLTE